MNERDIHDSNFRDPFDDYSVVPLFAECQVGKTRLAREIAQ